MPDRIARILTDLGNRLREKREAAGNSTVPASFGADCDMFAHEFLSRELKSLRPDIPVVSEEDAASQQERRPEVYWLIDPIDGTASFCGGYPGYVTQLALMEKGTPVAGGVYAPVTGELFLAEANAGSTLNGNRLRLDSAPRRRRLIDNYPAPRSTAAGIYEILRCDGYVESGSLGLKICRIADGTAEIFFKDVILRDWDIAPADLILREAGGLVTGVTGEAFPYSGNFVKPGVIAAANRSLVMETAGALKGVAA